MWLCSYGRGPIWIFLSVFSWAMVLSPKENDEPLAQGHGLFLCLLGRRVGYSQLQPKDWWLLCCEIRPFWSGTVFVLVGAYGCVKVQSPRCSSALSTQSSKNWLTVPPNFSRRQPELSHGSGCQPTLCVLAVGCPCSVGVFAEKALSCMSWITHLCWDREEIWRSPSKYPMERQSSSTKQCTPWSTPWGAGFLLGSLAGSRKAYSHHPFHTAGQQEDRPEPHPLAVSSQTAGVRIRQLSKERMSLLSRVNDHREACTQGALLGFTAQCTNRNQSPCTTGSCSRTHWVCILCHDSPGSSRFRDDFKHLLEIHSGILFSKNISFKSVLLLWRERKTQSHASVITG